jgi:hypothetical protein
MILHSRETSQICCNHSQYKEPSFFFFPFKVFHFSPHPLCFSNETIIEGTFGSSPSTTSFVVYIVWAGFHFFLKGLVYSSKTFSIAHVSLNDLHSVTASGNTKMETGSKGNIHKC